MSIISWKPRPTVYMFTGDFKLLGLFCQKNSKLFSCLKVDILTIWKFFITTNISIPVLSLISCQYPCTHLRSTLNYRLSCFDKWTLFFCNRHLRLHYPYPLNTAYQKCRVQIFKTFLYQRIYPKNQKLNDEWKLNYWT